jgi:protocatechuate 3,4-dioxygenase beta subunit
MPPIRAQTMRCLSVPSPRLAHPRRRLLGAGAALVLTPSIAFAAVAGPGAPATPAQMQGPFYPQALPLDQDNDLTQVRGRTGRARGVVTDIGGVVVDLRGQPVADVAIEIWQVNGYGRYHHPDDESDLPVDPNFQGFGHTVTARDGAYRFRTIRPLPYPGRAPHIHFALKGRGFGPFYTQMYLAGAPENATDFLLTRVRDPRERDLLIVALEGPSDGAAPMTGRFDIVLGHALLQRER